jgi:hypothetical protein
VGGEQSGATGFWLIGGSAFEEDIGDVQAIVGRCGLILQEAESGESESDCGEVL